MARSKRRVLVIGATGRIGSVVVSELLAHRADDLIVAAAVRDARQAESLRSRGVETRQLDLNRPETIAPALADVHTVFLLTGYSVEMLVQSKAVVDASVRAGVTHIVHLGVLASPDTIVPHNAWHQMIETYIERSGLRWTHLHPNWFMQLVPWLCGEGLRRDGTLAYFIGDKPVSWIDSDDIARAAAVVLRDPAAHHGQRYELAHEVLGFPALADKLTARFRRPYRFVDVTPDQFLATVLEHRLVEPEYARSAHRLFTELRADRLPEATRVPDDYRRLTGREPATWDEFLDRHAAEFRYE